MCLDIAKINDRISNRKPRPFIQLKLLRESRRAGCMTQMDTMHSEMLKAVVHNSFNILVSHESDYFKVVITYLQNDEDLLIIVHIPYLKIKEL